MFSCVSLIWGLVWVVEIFQLLHMLWSTYDAAMLDCIFQQSEEWILWYHQSLASGHAVSLSFSLSKLGRLWNKSTAFFTFSKSNFATSYVAMSSSSSSPQFLLISLNVSSFPFLYQKRIHVELSYLINFAAIVLNGRGN